MGVGEGISLPFNAKDFRKLTHLVKCLSLLLFSPMLPLFSCCFAKNDREEKFPALISVCSLVTNDGGKTQTIHLLSSGNCQRVLFVHAFLTLIFSDK